MVYLIFSLLLCLFNIFVLIKTYKINQKLKEKNDILGSIIFYITSTGKIDKYDLLMARHQAFNDLDNLKNKKRKIKSTY